MEADDFKVIRDLLDYAKHPVIAEGNIDTPEKLKRVLDLGCYSCVVGSIITRPQLITKRFVDAIKSHLISELSSECPIGGRFPVFGFYRGISKYIQIPADC